MGKGAQKAKSRREITYDNDASMDSNDVEEIEIPSSASFTN
jgi:hypothetical protein